MEGKRLLLGFSLIPRLPQPRVLFYTPHPAPPNTVREQVTITEIKYWLIFYKLSHRLQFIFIIVVSCNLFYADMECKIIHTHHLGEIMK